MTHFSIEPRTRKYAQEYKFSSFVRSLCNIYGKTFLYTAVTKDWMH